MPAIEFSDGLLDNANCQVFSDVDGIIIAPPPPPPSEVWIDDDYTEGSCGEHVWDYDAFDTIQEGIDGIADAGTINVAAGTYDEQVVIEDSLTLQGAGDTTIIQPSQVTVDNFTLFHRRIPGHASGDGKTAAIIVVNDVNSAESVTIKDIKIDALNVETNTSGASKFVEMLCTGSNATIDGVTFYGNLDWPDDALYLTPWDQAAVTVEVKNCDFSRFWFNAITANFSGLIANIHHNIITGRGQVSNGAGNGIQYGWGCTGTASYNTISDLAYISESVYVDAGIMFWATNATASNNTITDCQTGVLVQAREAGTFVVTVENNTISAPGLSAGVRDIEGINVSANENSPSITATIQGNDLSGGGLGDGIGIGLSEGGDSPNVTATISNNKISGWKEGIWLAESTGTVTITGNTIANNDSTASGIHVIAGVDVSNVEAHFNNIEGNTGYGVYNGGTGTFDAVNNQWGDASGPTHVDNPDGTGDAVSNNVNYDPWLGADVEESKIEDVSGTGGTIPADESPTGGEVTVSGAGIPVDAALTVATYADNPGGATTFTASGDYWDVHLSNDTNVDSVTVNFCPADSEDIIYYWDGSDWIACSNQVYDGVCITVTIETGDTAPSLADLTGLPFASSGTGVGADDNSSSCFIDTVGR